ncbi:PLP-dependent transferase [Tabrizicola caldifontis]|uniref:PLP-dependent transferase n=1 Tax=Tabrizicola caldifontis TaxID=2528036 RepID=UPI0023EF5538|nr:PLP-dependent transferase [Rhodobacter sp. YIM 73028]
MPVTTNLPPAPCPTWVSRSPPCDLTDPAAVRAALRPTTRLIHAETPCNPIPRLTDLAALLALAREAGALLSVDSTLATPVISPGRWSTGRIW